jgi:hypothetical protein
MFVDEQSHSSNGSPSNNIQRKGIIGRAFRAGCFQTKTSHFFHLPPENVSKNCVFLILKIGAQFIHSPLTFVK